MQIDPKPQWALVRRQFAIAIALTLAIAASYAIDAWGGGWSHGGRRARGPGGGAAVATYVNAYSVSFDGSDDFVQLPDTPDYDVAVNSHEITIAAWFHITAHDTSASHMVVAKDNDIILDGIQYWMFRQDPAVNNRILGVAGGVLLGNDGTVAISTWYLVTLVVKDVSGTMTARLYLDTTQIGSDVTAGNTAITNNFRIGTSFATNRTLKGYIDEVAIFDDVGFSAAEVAELHNGGSPIDLTTHSQADDLAHWWRMGDGPGDVYPTIVDQIGTYDGTMTNMAGPENFVTVVP